MWAFLVIVGEAALAFLTLDLYFRYMAVEPARLKQQLGRYALGYGCIAAAACLAGAWAQWRAASYAGLIPALGNWAPWWMLWRFGLRKQFTFLYKSDGGQAL